LISKEFGVSSGNYGSSSKTQECKSNIQRNRNNVTVREKVRNNFGADEDQVSD
jgi:hypothetical protein